MTMLDRYLLRSSLGLFAGLILLALSILMLARLIRLTEMLSGAENALGYGIRMVANLVPFYFDLALPGALLIAVVVSVDRLSRSGEIVALLASGVSLWRIARPFALLGAVMAVVAILISGFVQPLSRYNFRQIVFDLQQGSIITAFRQQQFLQFDGRTIWTDRVADDGRTLGRTFIVETAPDGSSRFLAGAVGMLRQNDTGGWVISIEDAMIGRVPAAITAPVGDRFTLRSVDWALPVTEGSFRIRGNDQRELTLDELFTGSYRARDYVISDAAASGALHDRLGRAALLFFMPLLGVVLGLNPGRKPRPGGVAIGILVLLLVQKLLEFGLQKAVRGEVAGWAGIWPVVIGAGVVSIWLFHRVAAGQSLLPGWRRAAPAPSGGPA